MELLLISENKIKISLTKADLDGYSITSDDIDYDNTETRRVFWTLLDEAKRKTGFDAAKSRIFIQIYPGKDGGCELYVSKISRAEKDDEISLNVLRELSKISKESKEKKPSVYLFDGMSELIAVCRRLKSLGYSQSSSAYSEGKSRFFLSVDGDGEYSFIEEYGIRQSTEKIMLYIKEHCGAICEGDAVIRLGEL